MSELHSWLSTQHHGLQTYKSLSVRLIMIVIDLKLLRSVL
jgi:hypothetical protein